MTKPRKRSIVGSSEAKAHLLQLLREVEAGLTITITKHGRPVARLVPAFKIDRPAPEGVIASLRQARHGIRLEGLSLRELTDEGRR